MTEQEEDPPQDEPIRSTIGKRSWTRWLVAALVVAAVGRYLLYADFDRPIRDVVDVLDYSSTEGFGPLGQEADWNFAAILGDRQQVKEIDLHGLSEPPTRFAAESVTDDAVFAARLTNVHRLSENEVFAIYYGRGVIARPDGSKREVRLLEPAGVVSKSATISDAVVVDRKLSILIRGRLNGRQRGTLVTYQIPEIDWSDEPTEPLVLRPESTNRIDPPFVSATFIKGSDDWAALTREGQVNFSWGRSVDAPVGTRRLWSRDSTKLIAHTYHDSSVAFHELDLSDEPIAFGPARVTLSPLKYSTGHVEISPDGRYALVMRNMFFDRNTLGIYWSKASTDFTLLSLDDWTVKATARESTNAWRATVCVPYWQAAFTHDRKHLRLLRSSQQLEIVDIDAWIRSCGGDE